MSTFTSLFGLQDRSLNYGNQSVGWAPQDWWILSLIVIFAAVLRLVFFNGFFGSDDLVYLSRSLEISQGIWSSANYNGALRYGYNIPAAFFIYLFGLNAFTANMWTLLCSLGEVALVYYFAARFIGRQAAIFAALVLACIPLHIALGTRIHADSVFAFFLTLAFVLFYMAVQSSSRRLYFATGLALGMIFWVKELGIIVFLAFATYPILARRVDKDWVWVIVGGLVMLAGHLILMQLIAGDPLHLIKTVTGQVQNSFIQSSHGDDSAGYYFRYLFLDIKHTWIAPFIAVVAIGVLLSKRDVLVRGEVFIYIAWWLLGLLIVLSFTPVSFNPIRLAMKQSNYLNLFLAPIALLSGVLLAKLSSRALKTGLIVVVMLGGIVLGALEQHAYKIFTANSKAAVDFIKALPGEWIVGSVNNGNYARVVAILEGDPELSRRFGYLTRDSETNSSPPLVGVKPSGYAIIDLETAGWGRTSIKQVSPAPCWEKITQLTPKNEGAGYTMLRMAGYMSGVFPDFAAQPINLAVQSYLAPKTATIYRVDGTNLWCKAAAPVSR